MPFRAKGDRRMISRIVLALAAVTASVGLTLYGMGTSYSPVQDWMKNLGLVLGLGGLVFTIIGMLWYRKTEEAEVQAARVKYGDDRIA